MDTIGSDLDAMRSDEWEEYCKEKDERETLERYATSARAIALWLSPFCDNSLYYPEMTADAARKAMKHIEVLVNVLDVVIEVCNTDRLCRFVVDYCPISGNKPLTEILDCDSCKKALLFALAEVETNVG
jgi:hypothetical protein